MSQAPTASSLHARANSRCHCFEQARYCQCEKVEPTSPELELIQYVSTPEREAWLVEQNARLKRGETVEMPLQEASSSNWRVNLWLDDVRPAPDGWVWVKTAAEAIAHFARGEVDTASLDHDLGPAEAGNGYEVLCWVEKAMAEHAWYGPLPRIYIHSANPVGRKRMLAVLPQIEKHYRSFRGDV